MKGIVLTQLLDMVESKYGYEMVDELLTESELPSGGAYTAIGTYHHSEMTELLGCLSRKTGTPVSALLHEFGRHLFGSFMQCYGHFFQNIGNSFDFLERVETCFHTEVRKLYPDVELPQFIFWRLGEDSLEMICHASRRMAHLAEGLLAACLDHFGEPAEIQHQVMDASSGRIRFVIEREVMEPAC